MKRQKFVKIASVAVLTLGAIVLTGRLSTPPSVQAQDNRHNLGIEASRIKLGFEIAPVPLNLAGKDPNLVGLGSYWVNAVSDCNFCHTAGGPPNLISPQAETPTLASQRKPIRPRTWLEARTSVRPCPQASTHQATGIMSVQTLFPAT